jgi:hypothetical protein
MCECEPGYGALDCSQRTFIILNSSKQKKEMTEKELYHGQIWGKKYVPLANYMLQTYVYLGSEIIILSSLMI